MHKIKGATTRFRYNQAIKYKFPGKFCTSIQEKKCRKKKYRLKIIKMNALLRTCRYLDFRINRRPKQSISAGYMYT